MSATAAILFHPDGYSVARNDLKGRHSAGAGFLRAVARHLPGDVLWCVAASRDHAAQCAAMVQEALGRPRGVRWVAPDALERLDEPGCLFLPGPGLDEFAWRRRVIGQRRFSLCGVTHTICTDRVMDTFGQLAIAPVQPWDALIVTSTAARTAIERVLLRWGDYLAARIGCRPDVPVRLPVIPLGVHADDFAPTDERRDAGRRLRAELGISDDTVAALYFGRLSFHAKAHPGPLFLACERALRRTRRPFHLIMTGAAANEAIERQFREGAATLCPSVPVSFVDGADGVRAPASWAAADLFVSLSDSVQETFGLTPIEAQAAGLPAIVSDWDGYRDTVEDGVTGLRVATTLPPGGAGGELAFRHMAGVESPDRYMGAVSQATAVDVEACAAAIARLVGDSDLRRRMGEAGRRRVLERYDWAVVLRAYRTLWEELAELRRTAPEIAPCGDGPAVPLRDDPFAVFAGFASRSLNLGVVVSCPHADPPAALDTVRGLSMNTFAEGHFLPAAACRDLLVRIAARPAGVDELLAGAPGADRDRVARTILWLAKNGLAELTFDA